MMGQTSLQEIKAVVYKNLAENGVQIRNWLDREMAKLKAGPRPDPRATESLEWIRDALEKAVKQKKPRKKPSKSTKRKRAPAA